LEYFKHIELEGWEPAVANIHKFVQSRTHILNKSVFWNILNRKDHAYCYNQLDPLFQKAGFNLLRISFIILFPKESNVHQDLDYIEDFPERVARINFPVLNCSASETRFFSAVKWEPIVKTLPNGINYAYHSIDNVKLEAQTTINQPTVLRVRELHQVVNHSKSTPRLSITCAVDPDPVYLLEEN